MQLFPPFNNLQESVYATVAYLDLFDFAPTTLEVEKYLLRYGNGTEKPTYVDIEDALQSHSTIIQTEGFWHFTGRKDVAVIRKRKYNYTEAKWQHAKPYLYMLASLPFVRGIWFGNSMGWNNSRKDSDIDLVILTAPNRIWTARFFTTTLMKLFRQRPGEQKPSKALCLSMYINSDKLSIGDYRESEQDIYYAFWCAQLFPVYNTELFQQFAQRNPWLNEVFHNIQWARPVPARRIQSNIFHRTIQNVFEFVFGWTLFEKWIATLQRRILPDILKKMANTDTRVMLQNDILKFHTNDQRTTVLKNWQERLKQNKNS